MLRGIILLLCVNEFFVLSQMSLIRVEDSFVISTHSLSANSALVSIEKLGVPHDFIVFVDCSSPENSPQHHISKCNSFGVSSCNMTFSKLLECSSYRCIASVHVVWHDDIFIPFVEKTVTLLTDCSSPFTVKPKDGHLSVKLDATLEKYAKIRHIVDICVRNSSCGSGIEPYCYFNRSPVENSHLYEYPWILQPQSNIDVCVIPVDITTSKTRGRKNCTCFVPKIQDCIKFQPLNVTVQNITSKAFVLRGWLQSSFLNKSNNPVNVKIKVQWKAERVAELTTAFYTASLDKHGVFQKNIDGLQPGRKYDVKVTGRSRTGFEIEAYHESIVTKFEGVSHCMEKKYIIPLTYVFGSGAVLTLIALYNIVKLRKQKEDYLKLCRTISNLKRRKIRNSLQMDQEPVDQTNIYEEVDKYTTGSVTTEPEPTPGEQIEHVYENCSKELNKDNESVSRKGGGMRKSKKTSSTARLFKVTKKKSTRKHIPQEEKNNFKMIMIRNEVEELEERIKILKTYTHQE